MFESKHKTALFIGGPWDGQRVVVMQGKMLVVNENDGWPLYTGVTVTYRPEKLATEEDSWDLMVLDELSRTEAIRKLLKNYTHHV